MPNPSIRDLVNFLYGPFNQTNGLGIFIEADYLPQLAYIPEDILEGLRKTKPTQRQLVTVNKKYLNKYFPLDYDPTGDSFWLIPLEIV